ncbi:hypothetical protein JCM10049v2_003501 [Rhodotorula toruloides]
MTFTQGLVGINEVTETVEIPVEAAKHIALLADSHGVLFGLAQTSGDAITNGQMVVAGMKQYEEMGFEVYWQGEGGARGPDGLVGAGHAAAKKGRQAGEVQLGLDGLVGMVPSGLVYEAIALGETAVARGSIGTAAAPAHAVVSRSEGEVTGAALARQLLAEGSPIVNFDDTIDQPELWSFSTASSPEDERLYSQQPLSPHLPRQLDPRAYQLSSAQPLDDQELASTAASYLAQPLPPFPAPRAVLRIPASTMSTPANAPVTQDLPAAPPAPPPADWAAVQSQPTLNNDEQLATARTTQSGTYPPPPWPLDQHEDVSSAPSPLFPQPPRPESIHSSLPVGLRGILVLCSDSDAVASYPPELIVARRISRAGTKISLEVYRVGAAWRAGAQRLIEGASRLLGQLKSADERYSDDAGEEDEQARREGGLSSTRLEEHPHLRRLARRWRSVKEFQDWATRNVEVVWRAMLVGSGAADDTTPFRPLPKGSRSPVGPARFAHLSLILRNNIDDLYLALTSIGYESKDGITGLIRGIGCRIFRYGTLASYTSPASFYTVSEVPSPFTDQFLLDLFRHSSLVPAIPPAEHATPASCSAFLISSGTLPPLGTRSLHPAFAIGSSLPGTLCPLPGDLQLWPQELHLKRLAGDKIDAIQQFVSLLSDPVARQGEAVRDVWARIKRARGNERARRTAREERRILDAIDSGIRADEDEEESRIEHEPYEQLDPNWLHGGEKAAQALQARRHGIANIATRLLATPIFQFFAPEADSPVLVQERHAHIRSTDFDITLTRLYCPPDCLDAVETFAARLVDPKSVPALNDENSLSLVRLAAEVPSQPIYHFVRRMAMQARIPFASTAVERLHSLRLDATAPLEQSIFVHDARLLERLLALPQGRFINFLPSLLALTTSAAPPTYEVFDATASRMKEAGADVGDWRSRMRQLLQALLGIDTSSWRHPTARKHRSEVERLVADSSYHQPPLAPNAGPTAVQSAASPGASPNPSSSPEPEAPTQRSKRKNRGSKSYVLPTAEELDEQEVEEEEVEENKVAINYSGRERKKRKR